MTRPGEYWTFVLLAGTGVVLLMLNSAGHEGAGLTSLSILLAP
jgi:hypothetical protein